MNNVHDLLCICVCVSFHYSPCVTLCVRPTLNQELSNIFNELWRLDVNRWTPGIDYTISVQVRFTFSSRLCTNLLFFHRHMFCETFQARAGFVSQGSSVVQDHAPLPLFSNINENKLRNITTFSRKGQHNTDTALHFLGLKIQLTGFTFFFFFFKINTDFYVCRLRSTPGQL